MSGALDMVIKRGMRGDIEARTEIPLGFDRRELIVTTRKASGGRICTHAWVIQYHPDRPGTYSHTIFGDYDKVIACTEAKRATEPAIRKAHIAALSVITTIEAEAKAYYTKEKAA